MEKIGKYRQYLFHALDFLPHAGYGYIKLFAVFGNGPAGYWVAFILEYISEFVIRKRLSFVLILNNGLKYLFDLYGRYILSLVVINGLREELLNNHGAIMGLHILAVGHTRYC